LLERDVVNLRTYFSAFAPSLVGTQFGKEIWGLYEAGQLTPDCALSGHVVLDEHIADVGAVLMEVELAIKENEIRRMCRPDADSA
jgi:RIO kinase 1